MASDQHKPPPQFSADRRQSLLGIPALNEAVTLKPDAEGRVLVVLSMRRRAGWLGYLQPARWERKIQLDQIGSFVIAQIDGRRNVLEITELFVQRFKVNRREAELSTVAFLKSLLERNVIAIGIP